MWGKWLHHPYSPTVLGFAKIHCGDKYRNGYFTNLVLGTHM